MLVHTLSHLFSYGLELHRERHDTGLFGFLQNGDWMNFIHEQNKVYLNDENNHMIAVVTFPGVKENVVNIDHTYVDNSLRGQGIAAKLMEEVVRQLRDTNRKAILSCSYALKWFEEHPECSDVLNH